MNAIASQNPGASAEAIQYHYDVSTQFYQLWLDATCTYSCALWRGTEDTLDAAQLRKLDFHIQQARAQGASRVLDIGCGWGSTLQHMVKTAEVQQAVGLTLSQAQAAWIANRQLPNVEVRLESWTDYAPTDPFDAIISIGAFEHFAKPEFPKAQRISGYRDFFQRCHQWLKPGGRLSLQTIVYGNASPGSGYTPFLGTEIFPESELPTLADIAEASERIFEVVRLQNDREDYKRTCQAWLSRLKANRAAAIELVGEETVARYEKYLNFCIIAFHTGKLGLLRLTLQRIDRPYQSAAS